MRLIKYLFLLTSIGMWVCAAQPSTSLITDMNQRLLEKQRSSDGYQKAPQVTASAATAPIKRTDFSERISFLTNGEMTVMIPKGAMIHSPKNSRILITEKIQGQLVEWEEFFLANRNAIHLEPVNAEQLQGVTPIDPKALERVLKNNLPALASFQNRVVSLPAPRQNPETPVTP